MYSDAAEVSHYITDLHLGMKERRRIVTVEKRIHFMDQLCYAKRHGLTIDVDGVSYANRYPQDVIAVMQRGNYMVDYDSDEEGNITAIHVNQISRSS